MSLGTEKTSIWRRVFATSRGHVAAAARVPATKPAVKFAPTTLVAVASSPTRERIFLLICTEMIIAKQHYQVGYLPKNNIFAVRSIFLTVTVE